MWYRGQARLAALAASMAVSGLLPAFAQAPPPGPAPAPVANDPSGLYTRKNGDTVQIFLAEGRLYCRLISGAQTNFEMCHGMTFADGAWSGGGMKHPDMPGFMTFNGTLVGGSRSVDVTGCVIGKSICDGEVWMRSK